MGQPKIWFPQNPSKSGATRGNQLLADDSNLTKTSPQAYMGKANQNFVKFWCEAGQTGPARLSWMLWKKKEENLLQWALRENWSVILPKK